MPLAEEDKGKLGSATSCSKQQDGLEHLGPSKGHQDSLHNGVRNLFAGEASLRSQLYLIVITWMKALCPRQES